MIEPSTDIVLRRRHLVRILVRLAIVAFVIIALAPLVYGFVQQVPYNWSNFMSRPIYTFRDELQYGTMFGVVALALWYLEGRLVRWIVPMPRPECPQCGYLLRHLTTTRCPECGTEFGSASATTPKDAV